MNIAEQLIDLQRRVSQLENITARNVEMPTLERQETPVCVPNKEYEILAFRATDKHPHCTRDISTFDTSNPIWISGTDFSVASGHWEIFRVKRSDGTVWELGQNTFCGIIEKFHIVGSDMGATCLVGEGTHVGIDLEGLLVPTPTWQIVEFKEAPTGHIVPQNENGTFWPSEESLKDMLAGWMSVEDGYFAIHAVSYNNHTWRVGDRTQKGKIVKFFLSADKQMMMVECEDGHMAITMLGVQKEWIIREYEVSGLTRHPVNDVELADAECLARDGFAVIKSVRRSDGQVFRVGDVVRHEVNKSVSHKITGFNLDDDNMYANSADLPKNGMCIDLIQPDKSIYTSADGAFICEGDIVWKWRKDGTTSATGAIIGHNPDNWYSTEAAAKKAYSDWLYGQEVLSLDDIRTMISSSDDLESIVDYLKEKLAKK